MAVSAANLLAHRVCYVILQFTCRRDATQTAPRLRFGASQQGDSALLRIFIYVF